MAAHEHNLTVAQAPRQIAPLSHVDDQEGRCISKFVSDIPYRRPLAHVAGDVNDRNKGLVRYTEWKNVFGMAVNNCIQVRTRLIDGAMDETFRIGWSIIPRHRRSIKVAGGNVVGRNLIWTLRTGDQVLVGMQRMTNTYVAVSVENCLHRQNAIGDDELSDGFPRPA